MRKSLCILVLMLCLGLIVAGCPKKTVMKDEPSVTKEEAARIEAQKALERAEAEKAAKEAREKESAGLKEEEARKALQKEFEKSLTARKQPGIEGEIFESAMLKDVYFDYDRYEIRPQDAEILKDNADLLKRFPKVKVQIEGHCDERGTIEYNLALGERRAGSARDYLLSLGISPDRVSIISYGEERQVDPGHDEEAWSKNRRAHTIIVSK
ncbi:MAG: peptidoglycan-associated lipoprotein [Deltaproteobacteria bacterium RBG_13_53_10]|nr:MAG: peptidoglycan-associated lipoprotein [Deltaproteobacteria bacterium RBG_13_53_10]